MFHHFFKIQNEQLKGLKKENLRDNMSDLKSVLTMLAETSTTELSKAKQLETFKENKDVASQGGNIAVNVIPILTIPQIILML